MLLKGIGNSTLSFLEVFVRKSHLYARAVLMVLRVLSVFLSPINRYVIVWHNNTSKLYLLLDTAILAAYIFIIVGWEL